jgi:hypothetical protein
MLGMRRAPVSLMAAPKFAYGRMLLILLGFGLIKGETEFLD